MSTQIDPNIRNVFDYFQNLNLLALLEDLRQQRAARGTWFSGLLLCPVAHGLGAEQQVQELYGVDQESGSERACYVAARHLGANPTELWHFVHNWDSNRITDQMLIKQLECLWDERIADAFVMQEMLAEGDALTEESSETVAAAV
jgi:hypothetical protein